MSYYKQQLLKYRLQIFAEDGGDDGDGGDGGEGENDDDDDDGEGNAGGDDTKKKSEKKFTQAEVDEIIAKRLKRGEKKETKKTETKGTEDAHGEKLSAMEAKLLCYEYEVAKESASDVIALAKAYMDEDTDLEAAIQKVIKKYPQFVKNADKEPDDTGAKKGWGTRQRGNGKEPDDVEKAFLAKNPGLKI